VRCFLGAQRSKAGSISLEELNRGAGSICRMARERSLWPLSNSPKLEAMQDDPYRSLRLEAQAGGPDQGTPAAAISRIHWGAWFEAASLPPFRLQRAGSRPGPGPAYGVRSWAARGKSLDGLMPQSNVVL